MRYLPSARVYARKHSASPGHSCLINDRRSRKTKQRVQYLWPVFRHVRMWCWVLSAVLASLLILTYITYVWQQELSDERCQISMRKSCFPRTWAVSCTQSNAATHQITGKLQEEGESEILPLPSGVQIMIGDIYQGGQIFAIWIHAAEGNSVSEWHLNLSIHQRSQMMSFISLINFFIY